MTKEKLDTELDHIEIKQTRHKGSASPTGSASPGSRIKIEPIRFKQDKVNKVRKKNSLILNLYVFYVAHQKLKY